MICPRSGVTTLEEFVTKFGSQLGYMLYFARNTDKAAKELAENTDKLLGAVYRSEGSNIRGDITKDGPWISQLAPLKLDPKLLTASDAECVLELESNVKTVHSTHIRFFFFFFLR
jgi:hypothetical protein